MGLAGGLVKRVFSKSRSSLITRDCNERHLGVDKSRWSSVRLYLCGDELNSVPAEDDVASVESSEATVTQPVAEASVEELHAVTRSDELEELSTKEENSPTKFLSEEDAAIVIQSMFRAFMARRRYEQMKEKGRCDHIEGQENPVEASVATSTEVQVGDSVESFRTQEGSITTFQHRMQNKARMQVFRPKEEWDDSTVSSNVSKLRIQNRLEATTRRERALAYAFAQQLRTCTTRNKSARSDSSEPNMGWSWLERWMATRLPENFSVEDCLSKHLDHISINRKPMVIKNRFDIAIEEKESCGSNDVSVSFDGSIIPQNPGDGYKSVRNRLKAMRTVSRRKTVPNHYTPRPSKVSKESLREVKGQRCNQARTKSTG